MNGTLSKTINQNRNKDRVFQAVQAALIGGFAIMLISALHPDVRAQVRGAIVKDYRSVVSTASGKLAGDERSFTVAKIKTRDSLTLEIYESKEDGSQKLVEKIIMPDVKDGFFNFNGQATNLAVDDVDGDGRPEILAPSFDRNLVGRLNVYNFDADNQSFQRVVR